MGEFKRDVLSGDKQGKVVSLLQGNLVDLIDLSLQLKQAHWNVVGPNFRSVHLQLDEIIDAIRLGSDEIAERIVTVGRDADGRAGTVNSNSRLDPHPEGFQNVRKTISTVSDRLAKAIEGLRASIDPMGDLDPISEDLLIGVSAGLEKHLWMLQAQEVD